MTEWGEIKGEYSAFRGIRCTRFKKYIKSPAEYWENLPFGPKKEFDEGHLLESYVFDIENFGEKFQLFTKPEPEKNMSSKANKAEIKEIRDSGLIPVTLDQLYQAAHQTNYIRNPYGEWPEKQPYSPNWLTTGGEYHKSFWWKHESGLTMMCEFDYIKVTEKNVWPVDLKNLKGSSEHEFVRACYDYNYPVQAAFYMMCPLSEIYPGKEIKPMSFLCSPKTKLPIPEVHYINEWQIEEIQEYIDRTLWKIARKEEKRGRLTPADAGRNCIELPLSYINRFYE